ncbi:TIGR03943 family putative permease subunit [Sinomonas atrocyanea]
MLRGFAGRVGVMLSLTAVAATLWLAATGRLGLYINPGYAPFATVLAVIGGVLAVAAFAFLPAAVPRTAPEGRGRREGAIAPDTGETVGRFRAAGSLVVVAAAVVGLLVLPPRTLTSSAASQRSLNVSGTLSRAQTTVLEGQDPSDYTVRDWASLLRYDTDGHLVGKSATLTGFVTPDRTDPANVFFITRFVITCCAVDAQPVGVPVYLPGWQKQYSADAWVTATGKFYESPHPTKGAATVITADQITQTAQPPQPYLTR